MRVAAEVRCIACPLAFCCANCRRAHERAVHNLKYECPICRHDKFLCSVENLQNEHLLRHLTDEHLPLHCGKCGKTFSNMEDLEDIGKCITITEESENESITNVINEEKEIEDRFNSLYDKISSEIEGNESDENFKALISINKTNNTATITPVLQKIPVGESSSSSEEDTSDNNNVYSKFVHTPYPKIPSAKTPRFKRTATPHIKKFLMRQLAQDIEEDDSNLNFVEIVEPKKGEPIEVPAKEDTEISGVQAFEETDNTRTPSRVLESDNDSPHEQLHTPTSHTLKVDPCAALASAVTTSTPTHPATQWALFPEPGADSPLSEIEGTAEGVSTSQQCSLNESSRGDIHVNKSKTTSPKKLKSIIVTSLRTRAEGQDSTEKQVTFADSACSEECSSASRIKKVKFAEDTKFDNAKPTRVFRRPKRLLTPGPQKVRKISNPRFQALLNQFESRGMTMARTPVYKREEQQATDLTPAMSELVSNLPARAINFKEYSPSIENVENNVMIDSPANELFKSCIESPAIQSNGNLNTAIAAFTTNIAGSIQTCLASALQTSDDSTEIQFKFVITKKKVSVRRIVDDGKIVNENSSEFERHSSEKEGGDNIWTTITKAVKNVFRSKHIDKENLHHTPPLSFTNAKGSLERYTSASKRKCEEVSDSESSPLNHKRYKYAGRIRGRRPLSRMLSHGAVCGLKMSHSAEQQNLISQICRTSEEENLNQSY